MAERDKFLEARVALIKAYADDYDTMTDAKAQELLNRRFEQLRAQSKLDGISAANSRRRFQSGG
jgi:hypothetical protein